MWNSILEQISKTFFLQIYSLAIDLFLIIIIILIGFIFSSLIKTLVVSFLRTIGFDKICTGLGIVGMLKRGGIRHSVSELIGIIFYWIGILVSLIAAFSIIGLTIVAESLNKIILYLPNVIVAIFVLILGMFISNAIKNTVKTLAVNFGIKQGHVLGKIAETVIIIFTALIALKQLKIHTEVIEVAMAILLASAGLAFALAFGIGCSEIAGKSIYEKIEEIKRDKNYKERR